ncbi:MAG TPA: PilZ domain-containing protein [Planctomycetota bacterium]|nr:PilZ domain-containing protein [Planctomycetota bacterium]
MAALKRSRAVRTRISFQVEIRGSRQSFIAEARDLSVEGICFSSPILLVAGERVGATLHFQEGLKTVLSMEIRWTRTESSRRYLIGAEFVHLSESRKSMQRLIWQIDSGLVKGAEPGA